MADRTRVMTFTASEDMDSDLRAIESRFQPDEFGEIVFRLNREGANTAGQAAVREDVGHLNDQLKSRGMENWPGEDLVTLDWTNKRISIRFVQTETPSSLYRTPSFAGFAIIGARSAAAAAAKTGALAITWAWLLRGITGAGRIFGRLAGRITRSNALTFVGTGLLIWSLIDIDSLVEVFKWVGKMAAKAIGTPLLIGFVALGAGLVLMSRGR